MLLAQASRRSTSNNENAGRAVRDAVSSTSPAWQQDASQGMPANLPRNGNSRLRHCSTPPVAARRDGGMLRSLNSASPQPPAPRWSAV